MRGRGTDNERGLTLLELVIALSVAGVVGLSFSFLYAGSQRFLIQGLNATSTQGEAAFALEHIHRNLIRATAITTPADGAHGATLTFTQTLAVGAASVTSTYQRNGTNLDFRRNTGEAFQTISRDITNLDFDRGTANLVVVTVTAQHQSGNDTRQTQLRTAVSPRGL